METKIKPRKGLGDNLYKIGIGLLMFNLAGIIMKDDYYYDDLNKDNLPDLIYKSGEKYLQTPERNFIEYTQEKADSLYEIYKNKLEKISQK